MITNKQRDAAYEHASPEQLEKYGDPTVGAELRMIAEKHSLTKDETYTTFALIVGDVILGLRSAAELPEAFTQELSLSHANAVNLTSDLIELLQGEKGEKPVELQNDIAEAEAALQSIPKVRTMADDVSRAQEEPVHSSTQSAILGEAEKSS